MRFGAGLGLALAALMVSTSSLAATLGGRLSYPSEALPAMLVVARDVAGTMHVMETKAGQARYRMEVPAGTYVVYAVPLGVGAPPPGKAPPRGAHTAYSVCGRDPVRMKAGGCKTGPLVEIRLDATDKREESDVDDWYLPDALVAKLEVPRPGASFEKYPADTAVLPKTRIPDFDTAPAAVKPFREQVERASVRGPGFAGRVVVARWGCGAACENWALVDRVSGRVAWVNDPALQPSRRNFPCDAEALEYREDSRLLRVHRIEGGRVVTQDFLWTNEGSRLDRGVQSAQSVERFCAR